MLLVLLILVLFILMAVLIKYYKCYWLISGYNTASKKEKERVDVEALGNFMGNMLFFMAGVVSIGIFLRYLGYRLMGDLTWFILIGITIYMVISGQRFYKEKEPISKKKTLVILLVVLVPLVGLSFIPIIYGILPNEIVMEDHTIKITGMYGTSVEKSSMTSIELLEDIPKVERKVNGFDFGYTLKGNFQLEEWGRGKIYLQSKNSPYLLIRYREKDFILINFKSSEETREIYERVSSW